MTKGVEIRSAGPDYQAAVLDVIRAAFGAGGSGHGDQVAALWAEVRAGDQHWLTRTIVNATGTWSRPFVPAYPGAETFRGRQLHPHDYPGPAAFRGRRVVVVGGGASAVQLLGEISVT